MDETTSSSTTSAELSAIEKNVSAPSSEPATTRSEADSRQSYGTAKTENLSDSGLWRFFLPAVVIVCCVALLAIPLFILVPLLFNSINAIGTSNTQEGQLVWLWIAMIVIEVGLAFIIIRGLLKIFMTQAGNYQHV